MLLSCYKIETDQDTIVNSVGTEAKLKNYGITIDELGLAVKKLFPDYQLWFKHFSTLGDLSQLVNEYKWPVGVEWQGVFDYEEEEEDTEGESDSDPGHYSIVTKIDTKKNILMILDPDRHYVKKDRRFTILEFERRWWDINEVMDPKTRKQEQHDDYHSMFIVTPNTDFWPEKLLMRKFE